MIAGIVAGWIPARIFSAIKPVNVLKGKFDVMISSRFGIRKMLVVVQFAVSLMAIISVVVFFKQSVFMATSDYGFNKDNMLNVNITPDIYETFSTAVSGLSGVYEVSASSTLFGFGGAEGVVMKSKISPDSVEANVYSVSPSIIETMGLSLLHGSGFPLNKTQSEQTLIINEEAARQLHFNPADAPGNTVIINHKPFVIAGVVKDFHYSGFQSSIQSLVLRARAADFHVLNIVFDKGAETQAMSSVEHLWKKLYPNRDFEASWYDRQLYEGHLHRDDLQFMSLLAGVTIVLACLGLLGIVVLNVSNRAKELSVRKIIGATMFQLLAVAGKQFFTLLLMATAVGTIAGYFSSKSLLEQYAYRIEISPFLLGACCASLLTVGMSIIFLNAFKVARKNPTENLRAD